MLHFNLLMRQLLQEITENIEDFSHIDLDRVQISATFNRKRRGSGLLAYVLPLKYKDGSPVQSKQRGNKSYQFAILPTYREGKEILYILYFMLPRFLNLAWRDKIETMIHELYHISPLFNGDLRRLKGRSYIHGHSLVEYDKRIKTLTDEFLKRVPEFVDEELIQRRYFQIERKWGKIEAVHIPEPKPKLLHVTSIHQEQR